MRVLVTTGTRYYYRPSSVVGEYWRGEVAEVLERVVVVSVKVAYTHTDGPHRLHHPTRAYSHTYTYIHTQPNDHTLTRRMHLTVGCTTGSVHYANKHGRRNRGNVWGGIAPSLLGPEGTGGTITDNDIFI